MRIFLSHASEDTDAAEEIFFKLIKAKHDVFFDRVVVRGGDDFDASIQKHIEKCELLIFLISPDSVARSSYALTELKFARQKWPHPQGHVLPVTVRPTSDDSIPQYLKAVSILEPEGNAAAEVLDEVARWKQRHRRGVMRPSVLIPSALLVASLVAFPVWYFRGAPAGRLPPQTASSPSTDTQGASPPPAAPTTGDAGRAPSPPSDPGHPPQHQNG